MHLNYDNNCHWLERIRIGINCSFYHGLLLHISGVKGCCPTSDHRFAFSSSISRRI